MRSALLLLAWSLPTLAQAPAVTRWAADTRREAQAVWGIRAPTPALLGQIQQESGGNPGVCSPYACGLTQFTPDTARWIAETYPRELAHAAPDVARFDPQWAIRAMVRYDRHLYGLVPGSSECDRLWGALRAYNGGLGHWRAESRNATDPFSRHSVDAACGTARRSAKHCPENLGYPRRILLNHQARYAAYGYVVACQEAP